MTGAATAGATAAGADRLRALHRPGTPLLLPNVWDAGSARLVAAAGLPAVATSSTAVADALGYADGEDAPVDEVFAVLARIAAAVAVPVTADLERGYRLAPADLVRRALAAGVVGLNLEDSDPATRALLDPGEQADLLARVRAAATATGVPLVLNARVDTFLRLPERTPAQRLADALDRGRRYLAAGADCVYPIGLADPAAIAEYVAQVGGPVNILYRPTGPTPAELAALGVARISLGGGVYAAAQGYLRGFLTELLR